MKILACHNYYQWFGGEDLSFESEIQLLQNHGHEIIRFVKHNSNIDRINPFVVALGAFWNVRVYRQVRKLIRQTRPQVMYCVNTFPLISPSVHYAARAEGIAVVQAHSNFRLECAQSMFSRQGLPCRDCSGKLIPWRAIKYKCYRDSRSGSIVLAAMQVFHRLLTRFKPCVDIHLPLSNSARKDLIRVGTPPEKTMITSCFIDPDPGLGNGQGGYAVFVGRLSSEKGVDDLLAAWSQLKGGLPLKIVGDGPLAEKVRQSARMDCSIEWMGHQASDKVLDILGEAEFLVFPTVANETFGRVVMEAFAKGTPVIASRIGAVAELVEDGRTGFLCEPGNQKDLVLKINKIMEDGDLRQKMRKAARDEFINKYTGKINYHILMSAFQKASSNINAQKRLREVLKQT